MGKHLFKVFGNNLLYLGTACLLLFLIAAPQTQESSGGSLKTVGQTRIFLPEAAPLAIKRGPDTDSPDEVEAIAEEFLETNKTLLGIEEVVDDLEASPARTTQSGLSHVRFLQIHEGLPVIGGEVNVHILNGAVHSASVKVARYFPGKTVRLFAKKARKITRSKARRIVLKRIKRQYGKSTGLRPASMRSVYVPLGIVLNTSSETVRLAWEVTVQDTENGLSFGETVYLDAISGQQIFATPQQIKADVNRRLLDCSYPNNSNNDPNCTADYWSDYYQYHFGRIEGTPARGPNPVPASPFFGSLDSDNLYEMLAPLHNHTLDSYGLEGANNLGGLAVYPIVSAELTRGFSLIEFDSPAGVCPASAFFDTIKGNIAFCVGMVVDDVVGHEYAHGIVHHRFKDTNDLPIGPVYYGQGGALNEAFADLNAVSFREYLSGTRDWVFASESASGPLRNLADPLSLPRWGDGLPSPDRFNGATVYCGTSDNGGAHFNSTIPSHAFYLISEGGAHNGCEISAQGLDVARRVFYNAWANYFSRTETFNEAYEHIQQACLELYGQEVCSEVTKALQSVEMDQPGACSEVPELAPACAVQNGGTIKSTRPDSSPTGVYAPGEHVWIVGASGVAGKTVDILLVSHDSGRAVWSQVSPLIQGSATVQADGKFAVSLMQADQSGVYDVVVDGDHDGFYVPWADSVISLEVRALADNDGMCYRGESYATSENCRSAPVDCACATGQACVASVFQHNYGQFICASKGSKRHVTQAE